MGNCAKSLVQARFPCFFANFGGSEGGSARFFEDSVVSYQERRKAELSAFAGNLAFMVLTFSIEYEKIESDKRHEMQ